MRASIRFARRNIPGAPARPASPRRGANRHLPAISLRRPWYRSAGLRAATGAFLAASAALAGGVSAHAGAWTPERGDGVVIVTSTFSGAAKGFDPDGHLEPLPEYRKFELSAHVEYGVTDWLTGVVHSAARIETQDADLTTTAVDGIGLRARVVRSDRMVVSAELTGYTPGLDRNGLWVDSEPAALEARALLGYAFAVHDLPAFVDVQGAYRFSAGGEDDEIHIDVTLGLKPTPRWLLMAQSFTTLSAGKASDYRYQKLQASALCWLTAHYGLQAGVSGTVDGVAALQERTVFAAIWYRF